MSTDPAVRDAATIMILREADPGLEVFMVRRHSNSAFMANRYVYPGGKLDAHDCTEVAARHVEGLTPPMARERLGEDIAPFEALGLFYAGIRETFEEAGILLARRSEDGENIKGNGGDLIDLTSDDYVARTFERYRAQLNDADVALSEIAEHENLVFPLDRLGYFAHWITPTAEPKRYDTRFFVAIAPDSQRPLHDARETTDSTWIHPADAVEQNQNGEFMLAPPTLRTLQKLAEFDSAQAAFEWSLEHHPPTILPQMEQRDGKIGLSFSEEAGEPEMIAENVGLWRVVG